MYYNYAGKHKVINTFVSDYTVTVYENGIDHEVPIQEETNGKYFIWKHDKIFLNSWHHTSIKEFKNKLNNKDFLASQDMCKAIISEGVENVSFIYSFETGEKVLYKIKEEYNRRVKDDYKIKLVSEENYKDIPNELDFYTQTLLGLIQNKTIDIISNKE